MKIDKKMSSMISASKYQDAPDTPTPDYAKNRSLSKSVALTVGGNISKVLDPRNERALEFAAKPTTQKTLIEKLIHQESSKRDPTNKKVVDYLVQENRERALNKLKDKIEELKHPHEIFEIAKKTNRLESLGNKKQSVLLIQPI